MKVVELISGFSLALSNEEKKFLESHDETKITSLEQHEQWVAQNLVRRGLYTISKDNNTLVKNYK